MGRVLVVIDASEPRGVREAVVSAVRGAGFATAVRSIGFCDCVVSDGAVNVCIERKSANDFVSSVVDGRLSEQAYLMSGRCGRAVVAVIGSVWCVLRFRRVRRECVVGALASLAVRTAPDGVPVSVVTLSNVNDYARFVTYVARAVSEGLVRVPRSRVSKSVSDFGVAVAVLSALPGVGERTAVKLLMRFGTLERVFSASEAELAAVVGPALASRLYRIFRTDVSGAARSAFYAFRRSG